MQKLIWIALILLVSTGFRVFSQTKIWERVNNSSNHRTKLFVKFDKADTELNDDLPDEDDLAGTDITVATAMQSIFDNYNGIDGAYIQLVDDNDPDYDDHSDGRLIEIKQGASSGAALGEASFEREDFDEVVKCNVTIGPSAYEDAKLFISVVTHELGHCLGLDHPQENTHAIMSYFTSPDIYRLQNDDKMGIIFLYPVDRNKVKEEATFGLTCARKE